MKRIYRPQRNDWIFLFIGLGISVLCKDSNHGTQIWTVLTFLCSIILTSIVTNAIENKYDSNVIFKLYRFVLNMFVMILLFIIGLIISKRNFFAETVLSFYINLLLIPILSLLIWAFTYDFQSTESANWIQNVVMKVKYLFKNISNSLFINKKGKRRIIRGILGIFMLFVLIVVIVAYKLNLKLIK